MCGRFVRSKEPEAYGQMFGLSEVPVLEANYNTAPTQPVIVVRMVDHHKACAVMRWGLIPFWAKDKKSSFINARDDSVIEKPAFKAAVKRRRCLVLADGYYEWLTEGKAKTPFYFHMKDDKPLAFAGIWDTWKGEETPIESCAIITTSANDLSRPIHDRMPAVLRGADAEAWLDPDIEDPAALTQLLRPYPPAEMVCDRVGPYVNSVKNHGPQCVEIVKELF
ncbi:MAG TPA: SOS response-associated peptidase [Gemmataceae bacterium]|nr:SOS response-associated peptidase [Gemmataceae bacterium]